MERILFIHPRLNVIDRNGYVLTHTRNSVIYILPYRRPKRGKYLLGRFEICPAHSQQQELYAITGQCEEGTNPQDIALNELYEEAGIIATPAQLISLGSGYLTKQADTIGHFFMIDVTHLPRGEAPTDGSYLEQGSFCNWISRTQALSARCVGLQALIARARF